MIARSQILAVFLYLIFQAFGSPISSEDIQTCTDLCNKCNGKTIIKDGKCECSIAGDDKKGVECMKRMVKEAELGMIFEIPETNDEGEGRLVRCLLGSRRKYKPEDVQKIAKYFMGGGPLTGSPLKQSCDPSEKMVGASKSDTEEPPRSAEPELPEQASNESEEPTLGAAKENPWCPRGVFDDERQSGPVQPANTYSKSEDIVGATQQLQEPAESKEILSSQPKLEQPQRLSDGPRILSALQQFVPERFTAEARILGAPRQLQQDFSDQSRILGSAQQPLSESSGFLGSLQLQLPQRSSPDARGGILGSTRLQLPQISDNSKSMLGASQLEESSSDPRGIFGNFQLQLPQFSADSRRMLVDPQSTGFFSNPRRFLGNLQLQPQDSSADSRLVDATQQIQQPQYSPVMLAEILNPQPFLDIAEALGRIQIPFRRTQNTVEGSRYTPAVYDAGSKIVGATQSKMEPAAKDPEFRDARKTEISVPKKVSQTVDTANSKSASSRQADPKVSARKNKGSDIVGAPKKAKVVNTQKPSDIVGAANSNSDCSRQTNPKVGARKNKGSDIVGAPKKAKVFNTQKPSDIVGAANSNSDSSRQTDPKVGARKNKVDASLDNSETSEPNLGDSLPVQPGYEFPSSAPKISLPEIKFYTLSDLADALAQRSMARMSNAFRRFQIPRYQADEPRQGVLEVSRSNSNSNNDPNDLEIVEDVAPEHDDAAPELDDAEPELEDAAPELDDAAPELGDAAPKLDDAEPELDDAAPELENAAPEVEDAAPKVDDAEPQLDDETVVRAPFRPRIGQTSGISWIPRTVTSIIGIFQPLVEQGVQLAEAGMSGQPFAFESPQVGIARSQFDSNSPQDGLSTPETDSPAVGVPSSNLKNSEPDSPTVGAPKTIGLKRIGHGHMRHGLFRKLTRTSLREGLDKTKRKFSRSVNENLEELPDEEIIDSKVNAETIENITEEAVKKEIKTFKKSEHKISEQKLRKLEKPLEKREVKPGVKLIEPKEKSEVKTTEKATEEIIDSKVNAETIENITEEAVKKEIEILKKSEHKTSEQKLRKLEKPLEKREVKQGVKLIEPKEKSEVKTTEKATEEIIDSKVNAETIENITEEAVKKEIETFKKSEHKTSEQKLRKLEKPLEKREVKPGVKLIEPKEKSKLKTTEKATEKSVEKVADKTSLSIKITKFI